MSEKREEDKVSLRVSAFGMIFKEYSSTLFLNKMLDIDESLNQHISRKGKLMNCKTLSQTSRYDYKY